MRATGERRSGLFEGKNSHNAAGNEIELGDGRCIPQRDESALTVMSDNRGVRKRSGDAFERRKIEAAGDFSVGCIQQNSFVGIVAGQENAFDAVDVANRQAGRVGDVIEFLAPEFSLRNFRSRGQRQKLLRTDAAVLKFVNGNSVASASGSLSEWISERSHRRVQVLAVETEGQSEEIRLVRIGTEAVVGKIRDVVGLQIENSERLPFAG